MEALSEIPRIFNLEHRALKMLSTTQPAKRPDRPRATRRPGRFLVECVVSRRGPPPLFVSALSW